MAAITEGLVDAARDYLSSGLSVIALSGKAPNGKFHPHGLNEPISGHPTSADDEVLLRRVFNDPSTTGVGILVLYPLVVVDIDGEEGAAVLARLTGSTNVPHTPVAKTGRGLHIWYLTAKQRRTSKLGEKLDLKGEGGYVAAPPSRHPDGHTYEWLEPLVDGGMLQEVEYLPAEIERLLDASESLVGIPVGRATGPFSMAPLVRTVKFSAEGNRNAALYWAACAARDGGASLAEGLEALGAAAVKAGLQEWEAKRTIRSAYDGK